MTYPEKLSQIEQRLREMQARCEAATPGPWGMYDGHGPDPDGLMHCRRIAGETTVVGPTWGSRGSDLEGSREDFEFIAHARTDLPALVGWALEMVNIIRVMLAADDGERRLGLTQLGLLARALGLDGEGR